MINFSFYKKIINNTLKLYIEREGVSCENLGTPTLEPLLIYLQYQTLSNI